MSGDLSLTALLEHPDAGDLTLLSGSERAWTSLVVELGERDLPERAENGFAVLVTPVADTSWGVDAMLRRVRDRGFTGVAVTGAPLGAGSRALAERLDLVVLHTQRPTRLALVCWEMAEARDALTLATVRRVAHSIQYEARDLEDLLRHVASGVGHGVALVDREGVLQSAGAPLPDSLRRGISFDRWLDVTETPDGLAASVPVASRTRQGLRVVLHGGATGPAHRASLSTAVEVAMPMVAARLLIDEVESVSEVSRSSGLLDDFLESRGARDPEIDAKMVARGWRTAGTHLGFRLVGRGRLDTLALLRFITTELADLQVDAHATVRGGGVSGWLTFTEPPGPGALTRAVRDLHGVHTAALETFRVATGVGSPSTGRAGLARTLGEARDAARLAVDRRRAGWFVHLDSLGLEQLLLAWTGGDAFAAAAGSLLAPLTDTERETLAAYLDQESSIVATAARLGLHRNTVTTRIQRIQRTLGADLHDPGTRLALQLASRVVGADRG